MIVFHDLKPVIKYLPIKIGNAEILRFPPGFMLKVDGLQWCILQDNCKEIRQLFAEINFAYGDVVTTGLGFGLVQTILLQKKEVRSITVYEKSVDVIDIFKETCAQSNFDISRLNIINDDADNMRNVDCDCLLMDHYERKHQPTWEIIDSARKLASNNNAKHVWFWSIIGIYSEFAYCKNMKNDVESFNRFSDMLNVKNLFRLNEEYMEYIRLVINENIKRS